MKRRVFVTGGAHGIGCAIVKAFCDKGDNVAFCDIDKKRGEETASITGALYIHADASCKEQLEDCILRLIGQWQDIDIIINNVGISLFTDITEIEVEEFDKVIATNLRSAFITSRMLARHRKANGNKKYGRIINLCSSRYLMSEPGTEGYTASKGGIFALTHALSISLAPYHITVNAIAPGWIHVDENEILRDEDHNFHPSGRVGKPEDIASMTLFLCEKNNDFINGQTFTIDGGVTRKMIYPE